MSKLSFSSNVFLDSVLTISSSSRQYSRCSFRNCINHHTYRHSYYFEATFLNAQPIRLVIFIYSSRAQSSEKFEYPFIFLVTSTFYDIRSIAEINEFHDGGVMAGVMAGTPCFLETILTSSYTKWPRAICIPKPPRIHGNGGILFNTSLACATIRKQLNKA